MNERQLQLLALAAGHLKLLADRGLLDAVTDQVKESGVLTDDFAAPTTGEVEDLLGELASRTWLVYPEKLHEDRMQVAEVELAARRRLMGVDAVIWESDWIHHRRMLLSGQFNGLVGDVWLKRYTHRRYDHDHVEADRCTVVFRPGTAELISREVDGPMTV